MSIRSPCSRDENVSVPGIPSNGLYGCLMVAQFIKQALLSYVPYKQLIVISTRGNEVSIRRDLQATYLLEMTGKGCHWFNHSLSRVIESDDLVSGASCQEIALPGDGADSLSAGCLLIDDFVSLDIVQIHGSIGICRTKGVSEIVIGERADVVSVLIVSLVAD